MASWFERMADGTRGQMLALLRRSNQSINSLAGALGISDNAVRVHIGSLQRDGMVETAGVERWTGGKPAQLYQITPEAEELFPKAYAAVLGELILQLQEEEGRDAAIGLLRRVGARLGAAQNVQHLDPEARVAKAGAVLRELGGDVEVQRGDAGWAIQGYGCPLSSVVGDHAEVCSLVEALVAEIAGQPVTECCDRGERPRCAFRVSSGAREPVYEGADPVPPGRVP